MKKTVLLATALIICGFISANAQVDMDTYVGGLAPGVPNKTSWEKTGSQESDSTKKQTFQYGQPDGARTVVLPPYVETSIDKIKTQDEANNYILAAAQNNIIGHIQMASEKFTYTMDIYVQAYNAATKDNAKEAVQKGAADQLVKESVQSGTKQVWKEEAYPASMLGLGYYTDKQYKYYQFVLETQEWEAVKAKIDDKNLGVIKTDVSNGNATITTEDSGAAKEAAKQIFNIKYLKTGSASSAQVSELRQPDDKTLQTWREANTDVMNKVSQALAELDCA